MSLCQLWTYFAPCSIVFIVNFEHAISGWITTNNHAPLHLRQKTNLVKYQHCVKSVRIRSFSDPNFPAFGLNTGTYSVSFRIQSKCGKIQTRKITNTDTFHTVQEVSNYHEQTCKYMTYSKDGCKKTKTKQKQGKGNFPLTPKRSWEYTTIRLAIFLKISTQLVWQKKPKRFL